MGAGAFGHEGFVVELAFGADIDLAFVIDGYIRIAYVVLSRP
jgi:hypothetical protein